MSPQRDLNRFAFRRNPSWLDAARIGLVYGLYWAPTAMARNLSGEVRYLGLALLDLAWAILMLMLGVTICLIAHVAFLIFGLLGRVVENVPQQIAQKPE